MNILMVNWTWYPSGGDWTYIENLSGLYEANGHHIIPFSMNDDQNFPTPYSKYFIDNIDYKKLSKKNKITAGIEVLSKSIYSFEAIKQLKKLLKDHKIGLAHLNLIHRYLTPAILKILKEAKIPIVWTLHDYTILCPESTFFSNNSICEACKGGNFYQATLKKCKKNSILASGVASLENYFYYYSDYYSYVDYFICPSKFHYLKFKEFNFFNDRLFHVYHSYEGNKLIQSKINEGKAAERFIVFVGRLEQIKGVLTLLMAMKYCRDIKLKIIGYGSLENELKDFVLNEELVNVEFLGKKTKDEIWSIVSESEFLVCPSEWYEVLGFTVVEAMYLDKPVIGSNIGAIPEMVIEEETGLLFETGNAENLSEKIKYLYNQPAMILQMGLKAGKHIRNLTDPTQHYEKLKSIIGCL